MTQAIEWVAYQGRVLYYLDGNPIGIIEEFYIDSDDGQPAWALVIPDLLTRACSLCRCVKRGSTRTATTYKYRLAVMRCATRPQSRPAVSYRTTTSDAFTSITTCPTPKRTPASTTRRQAVLRINRIKPAPTHAQASAFRAYAGDSFTRTVTRRRLDTKRT
jgi:hypothetical protein